MKIKRIRVCCVCIIVLLTVFCGCKKDSLSYEYTLKTFYPARREMVDSPTRILYLENGWLRYYNKLNGETSAFCFDPLCDHDLFDNFCTSNLFFYDHLKGNLVYCAYDNRFYFLRGQKFCSMSFDGSNAKVEHSFGESGDLSVPTNEIYDIGDLADISVYENYVFFLWLNADTGRYNLMRYDIKTQVCENLSEKEEKTGNMGRYYLVNDGVLFLQTVDEKTALYRSDYNLQNVTFFSDYGSAAYLSTGCFDGENFYMTQRNYELTEEGNRVMIGADIILFSCTDGTNRVIHSDITEPTILALTDEYIYFKKKEAILIGYDVLPNGHMNEYYNMYSKIFRLNIETGECITVLDDLSCEVESISLFENKILITGNYCMVDEKNASMDACLMLGEFDENGMVVDLKITGDGD